MIDPWAAGTRPSRTTTQLTVQGLRRVPAGGFLGGSDVADMCRCVDVCPLVGVGCSDSTREWESIVGAAYGGRGARESVRRWNPSGDREQEWPVSVFGGDREMPGWVSR